MKPKPASNIRITGSGKRSPAPSSPAALRAMRIGLIQAAWDRTVAKCTGGDR